MTETHIHADFVSGTRELARATGAEVLLSGDGGADWKYRYLDAARALLILDTILWPAADRGHPENLELYAPSIDVQARFHALAPDEEWLLGEALSPAASDGLVGGTGAIWSRSGRLLATGGQQMLYRPIHLNPAPEAAS